MTIQTGDNTFSTVNFIVNPIIGKGTHTTISGAIAAAVGGGNIFVRAGTYTEDLVLSDGIKLGAFAGSEKESVSDVTIVGKITMPNSGNVTISNVIIKTNSDFFLEITTTADKLIIFENCFLDCVDHTGISSNSPTSSIEINNCGGDIRQAGIAIFAPLTVESLSFSSSAFLNSGSSVVQNTISSGYLCINRSSFKSPFTMSGTSRMAMSNQSSISTSGLSVTSLTLTNTGLNVIDSSSLDGKSLASIDAGATSTVTMRGINNIFGDGLTSITGSGTLEYAPLIFPHVANPAAINIASEILTKIGPDVHIARDLTVDGLINGAPVYSQGTFTPTLQGTGGVIGAQAYAQQIGNYSKIGNSVTIWGDVTLTNKGSWTGGVDLAGLPFTGAAGNDGRVLIEGRSLIVSGGNSSLYLAISSVSSTTNIQMGSVTVGGISPVVQNYADITNNTAISFQIGYLV